MRKIKWCEFFQNNDGENSMSRLLAFMSFFPASFVLLWIHSVEALASYLAAYVTGYIGGKGADIFNKKVKNAAILPKK
jgi:hypothetical protein